MSKISIQDATRLLNADSCGHQKPYGYCYNCRMSLMRLLNDTLDQLWNTQDRLEALEKGNQNETCR